MEGLVVRVVESRSQQWGAGINQSCTTEEDINPQRLCLMSAALHSSILRRAVGLNGFTAQKPVLMCSS